MNTTQITLGGKTRTANLGLGFLGRFEDKEGVTITTLFQEFESKPLSVLPKLIFHSLAFELERTGQEVDFTLYDVIDWIDEDGSFNSPEALKFQNAFVAFSTARLKSENGGKQAKPKK